MERPKTHAERQLEREEALHRQEQQLTGGDKRCSITSADIPDQIERPRASKHFVFVGVCIIILLILAQCLSLIMNSKQEKQGRKAAPPQASETE